MRKIFGAVALAFMLVFSQSSPAAAYAVMTDRWFSTSAIDSNGNGKLDLTVCWGSDKTSPIYTNRGTGMTAIRETWGRVLVGDNDATHIDGYASVGMCGSANIVVVWGNLGSCNLLSGTIGAAQYKQGSYSTITVWMNYDCYLKGMWDYSWTGGTIDSNKFSFMSVLVHEVGHALRLGHSTDTGAAMHPGGPDHCDGYGDRYTLAQDDASGGRNIYPGIYDGGSMFPVDAFCYG